ncbi:MAG: hypothetical protein HC897_03060 [Thermoanaerobaculia bacterium]|nr:hypothetical protein [Thermoanaerobaculia bacterium]
MLDCNRQRAVIKIGARTFELVAKGMEWTRRRSPLEILKRGDVAWFRLETDEKTGELVPFLEQEPVLEAAALVLEASTGAVRAMVGGWSYDRNEFNRITQAHRQVGSAFKPFVYGSALENGFTAADTLFDGPAVFLGADGLPSYSPRNYKRRYNGIMTLRAALEQSINVPAVKLLDMVGVERVIDFARRCGVRADLPPYPSLALGSADITPLEMAAAYASFVNQGIWVEPYWIERITSQDGKLLEQHVPRAHKAMEPQVAYVLARMLKGVVDRGTAAGPPRFDLDLGGKTGTTNDYTDAWFVGFTPRYAILSWVGYDQKRTIGSRMTGARAALPIWKAIVQQGLEDGWLKTGETFARPTGIVEVEIEARSGQRAAPGSEKVIAEAFVEGTEPEQKYSPRWARILQLPWFQQEAFYLPKEGERMPGQVEDWSVVQDAWGGDDGGDG